MLVSLVHAVFLLNLPHFPVSKVSSKEHKSGVLNYKNSNSKALECSETLKIEPI